MTWYVVFRGRKPGVYSDWQSCLDQVSGFSRCSYRSYPSKEEAVADYLAYFGYGDSSTGEYGGLAAQDPVPVVAPTVVPVPAAAPARNWIVVVVCAQFMVIILLLAYILS